MPWDEYKDKAPDVSLASIYARVELASSSMRAWYWRSIRVKRWSSLSARGAAFGLFVLGTLLPLCAAFQDQPGEKLLLTQSAIALLAAAGLTQGADRIFGLSSGWMRYITTVTTMENLTRAFELEWGKYILSKDAPVGPSDVKVLFELAKGLEHELVTLQADETAKWVVDFNSSVALLESLIKTQRDETDKKIDAIRTSLTTQESAAEAEKKAKLPGAIEATLVYETGPKMVKIGLDDERPTEFLGEAWSKLNVAPGQHVVTVQTLSTPPQIVQKAVIVSPSAIARVDVKVPSE